MKSHTYLTMADAEPVKSRVETILSEGSLFAGDYVIIVLYFVLIMGSGLIAAKWSKRSSISGYFLASR